MKTIILITLAISLSLQSYNNYVQTKRLNEHKRIIIAQQSQINKLIENERIKKRIISGENKTTKRYNRITK